MPPQTILNKYTSTHVEFLGFFFGSCLNNQINKLKTFQAVLLPACNTELTRKLSGQKIDEGNHWVLTILEKNSATLRLFDSSHALDSFEHIIRDLLLLVNTICSQQEMTRAEWPMQWTYCREVYSVQQDNDYE